MLQQFPNSPEAEEALENAKVIYVEEGKNAEYVNFARSMGKEISTTQEEQLAYQEAEVQFNNGNFPAAAKKFEDYLERFPQESILLKHCITKVKSISTRKIGQKLPPDTKHCRIRCHINLEKNLC